MAYSSLVALTVVNLTIFSAASDENLVKMKFGSRNHLWLMTLRLINVSQKKVQWNKISWQRQTLTNYLSIFAWGSYCKGHIGCCCLLLWAYPTGNYPVTLHKSSSHNHKCAPCNTPYSVRINPQTIRWGSLYINLTPTAMDGYIHALRVFLDALSDSLSIIYVALAVPVLHLFILLDPE